MRKILYSLMMLAMLTPSLVCGDIMLGMQKAQAAQQDMPCHDTVQNDSHQDHDLMFFKDCLKVELAKADNGNILQKPDLKITKVFYDDFNVIADYGFGLSSSHQIRGPPIETAFQTPTYPSLYLTTQRLRI